MWPETRASVPTVAVKLLEKKAFLEEYLPEKEDGTEESR